MFDIGSLIGGIGSFLGGNATAKGLKQSARYYDEAGRITKIQGAMKDLAIRRGIMQTEGSAVAAQGANGLMLSGSVKDVIKNNRREGFMTKAVTAMQTNLDYQNYTMQASQARAQAKAAKTSGMFGLIGGIAGMFSDDRLKEDIVFMGRRGDGLGMYHFKFKGDTKTYEGVMANEVEVLYPEAVMVTASGYKKVDYDSLNINFKEVH